ncbi:prolipoprotein diacylglyceryl transferase [Rhodothalassium salexigens DSM 2132]|uniref:Phosphatidylglycerol--prolipoprotein diacylglyceryl transferase n=1 Tax=Rhodothalassium salexigens DSM 2132 TaxID=1188247 RepID=A0A4V2SPT5_RHOSA|nr:prolipoprotein diacylglyceryl transferase [Rhodothalassium salexigens]MBB4210896.1 phosphatidylglycerol:prolipoprotein diacylglycerol transferase [Rhodothalassium salexigens DSM 2132]TCP36446.1 prolipoprotein diacylglyceryl transferase [Rhodothalassium salexigens DSM 2132]
MLSFPPPLVIDYPNIDPVLVEIGPFPIRWYALAYFFGILQAYFYARALVGRLRAPISRQHLDDFILWATLGIVAGGRLGYVLFYNPGRFLAEPLSIFALWDGGMSFHGGLTGVIVAAILFTRANGIPPMRFGDMLACTAPIGLLLGRLANFINGELWGRPTDVPWAMVFPADPLQVPRHPSQLYEAALEGVALFALVNVLAYTTRLGQRRPGVLTGVFLAGYGAARFAVEYVRSPDPQLEGLARSFLSMGQLLSLPMILAGAAIIVWAWRRAPQPEPRDRATPRQGAA